jgi:hypothetical protein
VNFSQIIKRNLFTMKTSYTNKGALTAQESSANPVGSIFNESMNLLIQILAKLGLLTKDLDYHVVRATTLVFEHINLPGRYAFSLPEAVSPSA